LNQEQGQFISTKIQGSVDVLSRFYEVQEELGCGGGWRGSGKIKLGQSVGMRGARGGIEKKRESPDSKVLRGEIRTEKAWGFSKNAMLPVGKNGGGREDKEVASCRKSWNTLTKTQKTQWTGVGGLTTQTCWGGKKVGDFRFRWGPDRRKSKRGGKPGNVSGVRSANDGRRPRRSRPEFSSFAK